MAGSASMLNPIHAARDAAAQSRFRQPALVEASVTMLGRSFRTTIHEGATTNELIEKVARENGGEVTKKFYPEFQTWEITSVRIGGVALMKSSESGIHFSLGESGIPMAATKDSGIVFPNGDELPIGPNIRNIALWKTPASFDPGNLADLDRMYGRQGGVKASREALDEISRAHGGGRSGKIVLENNLLVLNKDTGEILSVSEHALKEHAPAGIMPEQVCISLPQYASCSPAPLEPRGFVPPQFDGFASRLDAGRLMVRTFDGSIAEVVRIQMNPFSQDKLDAGNKAMPKEQKMIPSPVSRPEALAQAPRPAFCMLRFGGENKRDNPGTPPPGPPPASPGARPVRAKCALWHSGERMGPAASQPSQRPSPIAIAKTVPITYVEAAKAWNERRSEPLRLGIPIGVAPLKGPKTRTSGRKKSHPQNAWQVGQVRKVLALAGILSIIVRLLKERAQDLARGHKSKKAAKAIKATRYGAKKLPRSASSVSAMVENTRNERRRKDNRILGQKTPIPCANPRTRRNHKATSAFQNTPASSKGKPAHHAARRTRAPSVFQSIKPAATGRKGPLIAKTKGRKKPSGRSIIDLLGVFRRKKRKITGRALAGN
ncbi:hypothetical protein L0Y65_02885 [Candidatus Micrarchaeota archaeon]|nr:hypothetical protein [Candidatus Micrarchaeota archaeon]